MSSPATSANSVSSSSTLWATASKEWIIAPKPKPGRKPKKDLSTSKTEGATQPDSKGRRVQNRLVCSFLTDYNTDLSCRAAQRAFRERKQSQLTELQARVQSYEQGEIERNVALQNIAKRLKEENESLRSENALLKEKILKSGLAQPPLVESDKKRPRDDTPNSGALNKRIKAASDVHRPASPILLSFTSYPSSGASSPDSSGTSDASISPLPGYDMQSNPMHTSPVLHFSSAKQVQVNNGNDFPPFDCGFCTEDTPCMCRELVFQQSQAQNDYKDSNISSIQTTNLIQIIPSPPSPSLCILENLPPYQPPVPLRRRPIASSVNNVFAVTSLVPRVPPENCSGDPSNCMACADDAFGKAFCSAIEESVASQVSCGDCPCDSDVLPPSMRVGSLNNCCGGSSNCICRSLDPNHAPSNSSLESRSGETMPTNNAWQQIKAHPNVSFADLALLAEVVSRRSKCTGPRVIISPALGSVTPERTASPSTIDTHSEHESPSEHDPVLLTDPHAQYRGKERAHINGLPPSPRLVPQDVLIRCGRQRVREVQTDAVRAALRLLDAKFT